MTKRFTVKKITELSTLELGHEIPTSEFSLQNGDRFVQFDFHDDEPYEFEVKPGLFSIEQDHSGMFLGPTAFTEERFLDEYDVTGDVLKRATSFFDKIDVYTKRNRFPRMGMLLYGLAGNGKTATIARISKQYEASHDTLIVIWSTDRFQPFDVSAFMKRFKYLDTIKRFILVVEDIGGREYIGDKMVVDSSLLSLLANMERIFKVPTLILATTNYPENLLPQLVRSGRLDVKIEVKPPSSVQRAKLLDLFCDGTAPEEVVLKIKDKRYDGLSVANIQDIVIQTDRDEVTMVEALENVYEDLQLVKRDFQAERGGMGLGKT